MDDEHLQYTIYFHVCLLSGKGYVGQTKYTIEDRWKSHLKHVSLMSRPFMTKQMCHFHNAIKKYGQDCWLHSVLETVSTREEADIAEMLWIEYLNTMDPDVGYNMTMGGSDSVPNKELLKVIAQRHDARSKMTDIERETVRLKQLVKRSMVSLRKTNPNLFSVPMPLRSDDYMPPADRKLLEDYYRSDPTRKKIT